jgi:hypothetical protein
MGRHGLGDSRLGENDDLGMEDFYRLQCCESKAKIFAIARAYRQVCERFAKIFKPLSSY